MEGRDREHTPSLVERHHDLTESLWQRRLEEIRGIGFDTWTETVRSHPRWRGPETVASDHRQHVSEDKPATWLEIQRTVEWARRNCPNCLWRAAGQDQDQNSEVTQ